jgi:sulfite reductase (NADPH) flavoprotein alpha-component
VFAQVYVQHRMAQHGAALSALVVAGAYVFVCGDGGQMAKDVNHALVTLLETHSGMKTKDVSAFVRTMIQEKRYVRDIWS